MKKKYFLVFINRKKEFIPKQDKVPKIRDFTQ